MSYRIHHNRFLRHAPRDGTSSRYPLSLWERIHLDPWLLGLLAFNAVLGLTVLYSASAENSGLVLKQAMSFGIGFVVMLFMAQIPPKMYQGFSPYFYGIGVLSLPASEGAGYSHHHGGTETTGHSHVEKAAEPEAADGHHHEAEKGETHEH